MSIIDDIKEHSMTEVEDIESKADIPLGSIGLNLACAEDAFFGACSGTMINIIGDESVGKTILAKTICAEINQFEHLDEYELIYDNPESIDFFEGGFFGEVEKRIKRPHSAGKGEDLFTGEEIDIYGSRTIQEFTTNFGIALQESKCIYILDSFDALADQAEIEKMRKKIEAAKKRGKKPPKIAGNYGAGKAKGASELFRNLTADLQQTGSFLLIISQTRENIDPMSFKKKDRNGGKALDFYAALIIWLARADTIKKTYRGREVIIGHNVKASCTKNKITGKKRKASFEIINDYGIDSIQSGIRTLIDLGFWKANSSTYDTPWGDIKKADLVSYIEENDLEDEFAEFVQDEWIAWENHIKPKRKRKY